MKVMDGIPQSGDAVSRRIENVDETATAPLDYVVFISALLT